MSARRHRGPAAAWHAIPWLGGAILVGALALAPSVASAHRGHSHQASWSACEGHAVGAACAWEDAAHARYVGTCRAVGGGRVCVRNRPIERPPVPGPLSVIERAARLTGAGLLRALFPGAFTAWLVLPD